MILRWDAPDAATLRRLLADPPRPTSLAPGRLRTTHFRDVYFDTSAGELRQRGARCRLRFTAGGGSRRTPRPPAAPRGGERGPHGEDTAGPPRPPAAGPPPRAPFRPPRPPP